MPLLWGGLRAKDRLPASRLRAMRDIAGASIIPIIEEVSPSSMSALTNMQTPADGFVAGTYTSTEGDIESVNPAYYVNNIMRASDYDLHADQSILAQVSVIDTLGNERLFYTNTIIVSPVTLANTVAPAIEGLLFDDQTVFADVGNYNYTPDGYDINWLADGVIVGTGTSLNLAGLAGQLLQLRVRGQIDGYYSLWTTVTGGFVASSTSMFVIAEDGGGTVISYPTVLAPVVDAGDSNGTVTNYGG